MNAISAIRSGLGRAFAQPRLILILWVINVVVALPLAVVLGASIHQSTGHSLVAQSLETGFDTFRAMRGGGVFLQTIADRETSLADALFEGSLPPSEDDHN